MFSNVGQIEAEKRHMRQAPDRDSRIQIWRYQIKENNSQTAEISVKWREHFFI